MPMPGQEESNPEMTTATKTHATAPKQSVLTVTYLDGRAEDLPLTPVNIYRASKEGAANAVELTYTAAWLQAGKPDGSVERWLETVATTIEEEKEVPPLNGTRRS